MMGNPLRALMVEDSPSDAALVVRVLSKAGYDVHDLRVETAEEMRAALDKQAWDVVIADYRLPQFDAPGALAVLQETGKDIPFLVVSAMVGEDVAVAMMRAGAHDYLMKDKLMRLAPAVERELREARSRAERRWSAETLRESEARFSTVFRASPIGISITRVADGRVIAANEALLRMSGFTEGEVIGRPVEEVHGTQVLQNREWMRALLEETGQARDFEGQFPRRTGDIGTALFSAERIELAGQPHLLTLIHDITERKQAEEALRASEARFRLLAENALDMVYRFRFLPTRGFEYVSPSATEMTGYTPEEHYANPQLGLEIVVPEDRHLLEEALASPDTVRRPLSLRWRCKDGTILWTEQRNRAILDDDGRLVAIEGIVRDINEQRSLQERSLRQDRLAAVGQLAAGIAHDFNNIMAAIILSAELVRHETGLSTRAVDRLKVVIQQAKRASTLTQQILDFSRQTVLEPRPLAVVPHLEAFRALATRTMPETIHVSLAYGDEDYVIAGDPARLDQVFLNLSLNARDAMPNGGELAFDVSRRRLTAGRMPFPGMTAGDWIQITVRDTGSGIPAHVLPRIFDPFFTTKDPGRGTGLGLAQVYGIIKQHGGFIDVASRPGEGTEFFIYLPVAEVPAVPLEAAQADEVESGSGQVILIVEDDEATRLALRDTLASLNYRPLIACNGVEALAVYEANRGSVDLVLCDMVMPQMGGHELLKALRARDPSLRVSLMTGYPLGTGTRELLLGVSWMQKPVDLATLGRFVRNALEATSPPPDL